MQLSISLMCKWIKDTLLIFFFQCFHGNSRYHSLPDSLHPVIYIYTHMIQTASSSIMPAENRSDDFSFYALFRIIHTSYSESVDLHPKAVHLIKNLQLSWDGSYICIIHVIFSSSCISQMSLDKCFPLHFILSASFFRKFMGTLAPVNLLSPEVQT